MEFEMMLRCKEDPEWNKINPQISRGLLFCVIILVNIMCDCFVSLFLKYSCCESFL